LLSTITKINPDNQGINAALELALDFIKRTLNAAETKNFKYNGNFELELLVDFYSTIITKDAKDVQMV